MKKHTTFKLLILAFLFVGSVMAATISRVTTFSDGDVLTAAQLNTEFDNVVDGVNSINNDNIVTNAAIAPSKISAAIKGDAISRNSTSGALSVNPDGSTIEISADAIRVKDDGITGAKLNSNVADGVTIEQTGTTLNVKAASIGTTQLTDGGVTQAKRAALGQQFSSDSGSFTTTSSSATDITNMSVTITTTGRPVVVAVVPKASPGAFESCYVYNTSGVGSNLYTLVRAATTVGVWLSTNSFVPCGSIHMVDVPAAGTYTYKLQVQTNGSGTAQVSYARLVAYEL